MCQGEVIVQLECLPFLFYRLVVMAGQIQSVTQNRVGNERERIELLSAFDRCQSFIQPPLLC